VTRTKNAETAKTWRGPTRERRRAGVGAELTSLQICSTSERYEASPTL
jgi:hypothetical protein